MENDNWPNIAIGTWSWGVGKIGGDEVFGNHLGEKELAPVVEQAMGNGFNLWDTAYSYGMGDSETILGNLLTKYDREKYLLSTKFTPNIAGPGDHPVADMLAGSLKRLHTDYINMYWIHNPDDVEKWTPQLIPLVKNGQIKHVGVSNHNLKQIKRAKEILEMGGIKLDAVQNHYSLLDRTSESNGILRFCKSNNIDFYSYMVIEQGALTGKYNTKNPLPAGSDRGKTYNKFLPQLEQLTDLLKKIGEQHGRSVAEVATAWAINKGTIPIIGVTNPAYIESEKNALTLSLSTDEIHQLEKAAAKAGVNTTADWETSL